MRNGRKVSTVTRFQNTRMGRKQNGGYRSRLSWTFLGSYIQSASRSSHLILLIASGNCEAFNRKA